MASSKEGTGARVVDEWHPVSLTQAFGLKIGAGVPGHWKVVDYGKPGICQARAGHKERFPLMLASRSSSRLRREPFTELFRGLVMVEPEQPRRSAPTARLG
jgi:hypothetical protein